MSALVLRVFALVLAASCVVLPAAHAQYLIAADNGTVTAQPNLIPVGDRVVLEGALPDSAKGRTTEILLYWQSTYTVAEPPSTTRTTGRRTTNVCTPDLGLHGWENRRLGWTDQVRFSAATEPVFPNKLYRFLVCVERQPTPTESARFAKQAVDSLTATMATLVKADTEGDPLSRLVSEAEEILAQRIEDLTRVLERQSSQSMTATERRSFSRWPTRAAAPADSATETASASPRAALAKGYEGVARTTYARARATRAAADSLGFYTSDAALMLMKTHRHPALRAAVQASFLLSDDRRHAPSTAALMDARSALAPLLGLDLVASDSTASPTRRRGLLIQDPQAIYHALAEGRLRLTRRAPVSERTQRIETCRASETNSPARLCIEQLTSAHRDTLAAHLANVRATSREVVQLTMLLADRS
ncbi:MAG: hypothetical protein AAFQ53_17685, partial [Bacteroidota bacterium]